MAFKILHIKFQILALAVRLQMHIFTNNNIMVNIQQQLKLSIRFCFILDCILSADYVNVHFHFNFP